MRAELERVRGDAAMTTAALDTARRERPGADTRAPAKAPATVQAITGRGDPSLVGRRSKRPETLAPASVLSLTPGEGEGRRGIKAGRCSIGFQGRAV